jgi:hypothetical protein
VKKIAIALFAIAAFVCAPAFAAKEEGNFFDRYSGESQETKRKGPLTLKTANNKRIKPRANAFESSKWKYFSQRNRNLRRMQTATKRGGYANINQPYQSGMWSANKVPEKVASGAKHLWAPNWFHHKGMRPSHPKNVRATATNNGHHRFKFW